MLPGSVLVGASSFWAEPEEPGEGGPEQQLDEHFDVLRIVLDAGGDGEYHGKVRDHSADQHGRSLVLGS